MNNKLNRQEKIIHSFVNESCIMSESKVMNLTEDVKQETVRIASEIILDKLNSRMSNLNITTIDRSRGRITDLRELEYIQQVIRNVEHDANMDRAKEPILEAIEIVKRALFNINRYTNDFMDAYRMKKVMLITEYQTVIISVISATNFIASWNLMFGTKNVASDFLNCSPFKTLKTFNLKCQIGGMNTFIKDVNMIREHYIELPSETVSTILESSDIIDVVIAGLGNFYRDIDRNGKLAAILFKAASVVMSLMSMREIVYLMDRSRFKTTDLFDNLKGFASVAVGGVVNNKLLGFSNRYVAETEENSKIIAREIAQENKEISREVKAVIDNGIDYSVPAVKTRPVVSTPTYSAPVREPNAPKPVVSLTKASSSPIDTSSIVMDF